MRCLGTSFTPHSANIFLHSPDPQPGKDCRASRLPAALPLSGISGTESNSACRVSRDGRPMGHPNRPWETPSVRWQPSKLLLLSGQSDRRTGWLRSSEWWAEDPTGNRGPAAARAARTGPAGFHPPRPSHPSPTQFWTRLADATSPPEPHWDGLGAGILWGNPPPPGPAGSSTRWVILPPRRCTTSPQDVLHHESSASVEWCTGTRLGRSAFRLESGLALRLHPTGRSHGTVCYSGPTFVPLHTALPGDDRIGVRIPG